MYAIATNIHNGDWFKITRPDGSVVRIKITSRHLNGGLTSDTFTINIVDAHNSKHMLNWHNCYSFGNGVESNRVTDTFNAPHVTPGVKVSTIFEDYKEEHRKYGLIYSGLYNGISSVNNLNQFIQVEKITKDINPIYGSIQKLHTRDTDLVTLCEDKVLRILANKDAVYNADGNPNLTATEKVLGQTVPFVGEHGISTNPESFVSEAYRSYFTDKQRGAVMRLSKDGLTPISMHGMKDWFRDNLKLNDRLVGSYDDRNDEYNITLDTTVDEPVLGQTVSFREDTIGWVSFKSFVPENAISCANDYFTISNGKLYKHYVEVPNATSRDINRNTFYDIYTNSSVNVMLNDSPGSVKSFHTLDYEGSQSKVDVNISDDSYYNLTDKPGWYVHSIKTDKQEGSLNEFIEKEGKWFNYIKGINSVISSTTDFGAFDIQGIGIVKDTYQTMVNGVTVTVLAFDYNINTSLQVNDIIYFQTPGGSGGFITIDSNSITQYGGVVDIAGNTVTVNTASAAIGIGDYVLFAKDHLINTSSLLGYYADVKFENNSREKAELFSVGSEIAESSK